MVLATMAIDRPTVISWTHNGKLVTHYHVQQWVQQNSAKLVTFGQNLSKPALAVGKGAAFTYAVAVGVAGNLVFHFVQPQVPIPSSRRRSLPIIDTLVRASGPGMCR